MEEAGREDVKEKNIVWLPSTRTSNGDQTRNHLVYRTMLQPTEPHWPGLRIGVFNGINGYSTLATASAKM